jgi:hypothetical protein
MAFDFAVSPYFQPRGECPAEYPLKCQIRRWWYWISFVVSRLNCDFVENSYSQGPPGAEIRMSKTPGGNSNIEARNPKQIRITKGAEMI